MSSQTRLVGVLVYIIAPLGTAMWAFSQITVGTGKWVGGALLLLASACAFLAFNRMLAMADDTLNGEYNDAADWRQENDG